MSTSGVDMIAKERREQIEKHGYTVARDQMANRDEDLKNAALAVLSKDMGHWPEGWETDTFHRILAKPEDDRLAVAGAFLAAQIDYLHVLEFLSRDMAAGRG